MEHDPHQHGAMDHIVTHPAGKPEQHWTPGPQPAPVPHLHVPALHVSPVLQAWPQRPQFLVSVIVFVQAPEQHDWPAGQPRPLPQRHSSPEHVSPGLHVRPQEPQL